MQVPHRMPAAAGLGVARGTAPRACATGRGRENSVMLETAIALTTAHLISDFLVQTSTIVARKRVRETRLRATGLHVFWTVLVLFPFVLPATATAEGWQVAAIMLAVTGAAHFLTDLAKEVAIDRLVHAAPPVDAGACPACSAPEQARRAERTKLRAFLIDQAAHLAVIIALAIAFEDHASPAALRLLGIDESLVPDTAYFAALVAVSAMIAGVFAGGHMIGHALHALPRPAGMGLRQTPAGTPSPGRIVGWAERALVIALLLAGAALLSGLVLLAKVLLRMGETFRTGRTGPADEGLTADPILIGTLLSFGWAFLIGFAALAALSGLGLSPDLLAVP